MTHLPEMEITAGEKDAVPWFDTRIGPKKYVSSGAHIYGRNIVTTEAYTFMHWENYRSTLEEMKIASDNYLTTAIDSPNSIFRKYLRSFVKDDHIEFKQIRIDKLSD